MGRNIQYEGVYIALTSGGPLTLVANRATPIPGGVGNFESFGDPAISGSLVAFRATDAGTGATRGIYYVDTAGRPLTKAIAVGDTLDGRTVSNLYFSNMGLDGFTAVFRADFSNSTGGVYAMQLTPVPEPTGAVFMSVAVLSGAAWCRRR